MARVFMESFDLGNMHTDYVDGRASHQPFKDLFIPTYPIGKLGLATSVSTEPDETLSMCELTTGRGGTGKALRMVNADSTGNLSITSSNQYFPQNKGLIPLSPSLSELYFRTYLRWTTIITYTTGDILTLCMSDGTPLMGIRQNDIATKSFDLYVKVGGSYQVVESFVLQDNSWSRVEFYFKANASTGAYELRIDGTTIKSASGINTGTDNVAYCTFGLPQSQDLNSTAWDNNALGYPNIYDEVCFDDMAINNTTGSNNNSWCGNGTIVVVKPNGAGNSSQWDSSQGYAVAESGTNTTTLKITSHGLSTNDLIYNVTCGVYSVVTVSDANTLTTSSITNQAETDKIVLMELQDTIVAGTGTNTEKAVLVGHNLKSYDVIMNVTRSSAIRRVLYTDGEVVYNYSTLDMDGSNVAFNAYGETVTSQASGDSIKTFKVMPYAISNHWEAVSNTIANPSYSHIATSTSGDIDLFDLEQITTDKSVPSGATIVAVAHCVVATGGGTSIQPVLRSGTDNIVGSSLDLGGGLKLYKTIYEESPFTSTSWSATEVAGLEAGVKMP